MHPGPAVKSRMRLSLLPFVLRSENFVDFTICKVNSVDRWGYSEHGYLFMLTLISHNPISNQFLEGYSPKMIADGLMEDSICTPSGGKKWYPSEVASILEKLRTTDFIRCTK